MDSFLCVLLKQKRHIYVYEKHLLDIWNYIY